MRRPKPNWRSVKRHRNYTVDELARTLGVAKGTVRYANVLVEVTGVELDREGMIKMPLNLDARQGTDWKDTLNAAVDRLNALDDDARKLRSNTGRYIRPIMLVQVERTGADQRDGDHIHAQDVKDRLLTLGFDADEIAIKTAEINDLNQPENQDLLSPTNKVRAIITKQALQEARRRRRTHYRSGDQGGPARQSRYGL